MHELELTWKRAFMIWWAITLRVILISLPILLIVVFIMAGITVGLGIPDETGKLFSKVVSFVTGIPIGVLIIKMALSKKYPGFRIVLEKIE